MSETEPHAVSWPASHGNKMLQQTTRWHWTTDASFTLCGRVIPLMGDGWMLPNTHDEKSKVNCTICRKKLSGADNINS